MKVYKSKVDHWLWILIVVCMLMCIFAPIISEPSINATELLTLLLSTILPSLIIVNVYTDTHYTIYEDKYILRVKSGFLVNSKYDINRITRIRNTRTWLSSPALSMDRIEITIGKRNKVVISPENKAEFVADLQSLNPNIILEE